MRQGRARQERRGERKKFREKQSEGEVSHSRFTVVAGEILAMFLQHAEDRARGGAGRQIYMVRTALAALEQHAGHILFFSDLHI